MAMFRWLLFLVGLTLAGNAYCDESMVESRKPAVGVRFYDLSPQEEVRLLQLANEGNGEACFRLSQYYAFVKVDRDAALKWLRSGAYRGHLSSQYNLGIRLSASAERRDREEARVWLEAARANGHLLAEAALRDLESKK